MITGNKSNLLIIALLIVLAELLMVAFVVDAVKQRLVGGLISQESEKDRIIAHQITRSIDEDIKNVQDKLLLISQKPEVSIGNAAACQAQLEKVFEVLQSKVTNLVRIGRDGKIYCALNKNAIGVDVLANKTFKGMFDDAEHKPILHRATFSSISNQFVAGIHIPVFSEKKEFLGTIGGVIYLSELEEKYFKNLVLYERGELTLIDDNGDILYNPKSKELIGKNLLSDEIVSQLEEEGRGEYKKQMQQVLADISGNRNSVVRYRYSPEPEKLAIFYPFEILPGRHWAAVVTVPIDDIVEQLDKSSLVSGLKSFSTLLYAMIAIILVTQVSLFGYLISHVQRNSKEVGND